MKLRICWLGLHKWIYNFKDTVPYRKCQKCGKIQSAVYDMSYGETGWC